MSFTFGKNNFTGTGTIKKTITGKIFLTFFLPLKYLLEKKL